MKVAIVPGVLLLRSAKKSIADAAKKDASAGHPMIKSITIFLMDGW